MGDAKRRVREIAELKARLDIWKASLSPDALTIFDLAMRLDERLVRRRGFTQGCYHLAFFMSHHLRHKGIEVNPVVGWVNDGLWDGITSHAWIEYEGKITDVSLTATSNPDACPVGALLVHDYAVRPGVANYTYFRDEDPEVARRCNWLSAHPQLSEVHAEKLVEHKKIQRIAIEKKFAEYLAKAPVGGRYQDILALIQ